jgi:hypothetical protein
MKITTCPSCKGTKKDTNGCGMRIDCVECNGTGIVDGDRDKESAKEIIAPPTNKPRRGRPAKK